MRIDGVAGVLLDLLDHGSETAVVVHFRRPPTTLADHVVVVGGFAEHVCMLAVGQIQALHETQRQEDVQGAEDGGPAHGQAAPPALTDQLGRREVSIVLGHHRGHQATGFGPLVSAPFQRGQQWLDGAHALHDSANRPTPGALLGCTT